MVEIQSACSIAIYLIFLCFADMPLVFTVLLLLPTYNSQPGTFIIFWRSVSLNTNALYFSNDKNLMYQILYLSMAHLAWYWWMKKCFCVSKHFSLDEPVGSDISNLSDALIIWVIDMQQIIQWNLFPYYIHGSVGSDPL